MKLSDETKREARVTLKLAGPLVFAQLGLVSLGFVDLVMVGALPESKIALGGVGIGNAIFWTIGLAASGILMAMDSIIGNYYGAGEREKCGRALWQGYWIAIAGACLLFWIFFFGEEMATALGQSEEVSQKTGEYLHARAWMAFPFFIFCAQRAFLSGTTNTRYLTIIVLVGNAMNVLMNWAWIYGNLGLPAMGVEGAGYATTCTSSTMVIVTAFMCHKVVAKRGCPAPFAGPDWGMIKGVLLLGTPFALHLLVEVGSFNAVTVLSGLLGNEELAAHQAALQLASVSFQLPLGLALAGSIRISNCRGAKDAMGAVRAVRVNVGLGFIIAFVNTCIFFVFAEELMGIFTDDADVIAIGADLVRIAGVFQLSDGMQVIGACCYRGYGNTRTAFVANLIGHWALAVPLGALLAFHFKVGVAGLWVGLTLGLTAVAIFLIRKVLTHRISA